MDLKKKQAFNQRMGKRFPRHQNLAKGGMVKHFDSGGIALAPQSTTAGTPLTTTTDNTTAGGVFGKTADPTGQFGKATAGAINFAGGLMNGVATAFTPQNGYQATTAPTTQYNYGDVIGGAAGNALNANGTTQNILAQQQGLSNQLQGVANGTGPNPAMAALNQQTGANVANQAALMAGQRGAGSNVGLMAREAAQQGAATQQQAVGQAATQQSQQQLNALGAIGQQQQNMANTNINQQNANTSLFGTGASANNAQNNTNVSNFGMAQGINSQVAQANTNAVGQTESGLLGGVGSVLGALLNKGGEVGYDGGGLIAAPTPPAEPDAPKVDLPKIEANPPSSGSKGSGSSGGMGGGLSSLASAFAQGGAVHPSHPDYFHKYFSEGGMSGKSVDAVVSPKEVYLNPHQVKEVVERGADPMKIGHHFAGKDKVSRDSLKNDVIKTKLEEGGVVLPIHITTHKDASHRGRKFVERTVAKHMKRPSGA
jgi:hypothetical protein